MDAPIASGRLTAAEGVALHYLEAGPKEGELVVLLHGFPEFSHGWRPLMAVLAEAGFHVIAPDQRGYAESDKPAGWAAYDVDRLVADVLAILDHVGAAQANVVGHDWGAIVAWWTATTHPDRVKRLIALSAGHPAVWRAAMRDTPAQRRRSWYVAAFGLPWLPERLMRAQNYKALADALTATKRPGAFTDADLAAHRQAWSRPGALTGMVNWYRAVLRHRFGPESAYRVSPPTLFIFGAQDIYAEPSIGERSIALCADGRLETLDATHWVQHDEPEAVARLILQHLRR